jgi:nucleotide-binding universal stress UspA family protein
MIEQVIACLDGSPFAEQILPFAHCVAAVKPIPLTLLRVVGDREEFSAEESYLSDWARAYAARVKVLVSDDPPRAIIAELENNPGAIPAMTTHGRTAWAEALAMTTHGRSGLRRAFLGSIAAECVRNAGLPMLMYWPPDAFSAAAR